MQETGSRTNNSISVQISLCGYAVRSLSDGVSSSSGWMGSDRFFTASEFQKRYDKVDISLFTPKFTLVPDHFFSPSSARVLLSDVADIRDTDIVEHEQIPEMKAVLVYSNSIGETFSRIVSETVLMADGSRSRVYPEIYHMLKKLPDITEYNKVVASFADGYLYLAISQGRSLQLCNSYKAVDMTTAEYFIFLAMKKLQLNPEVTTIYFRTPLSDDEELTLYRYFKSVDFI